MSTSNNLKTSWHVYILQCKDDTLYTGISNQLEKRIQDHSSGKGAKYTKGRGPFLLLGSWSFSSRSEASKEEYRIKQLSRKDKLKLIQAG